MSIREDIAKEIVSKFCVYFSLNEDIQTGSEKIADYILSREKELLEEIRSKVLTLNPDWELGTLLSVIDQKIKERE